MQILNCYSIAYCMCVTPHFFFELRRFTNARTIIAKALFHILPLRTLHILWQPVCVGASVRLHGLKINAFNGKTGIVRAFNAKKQRWHVAVLHGKKQKVVTRLSVSSSMFLFQSVSAALFLILCTYLCVVLVPWPSLCLSLTLFPLISPICSLPLPRRA